MRLAKSGVKFIPCSKLINIKEDEIENTKNKKVTFINEDIMFNGFEKA